MSAPFGNCEYRFYRSNGKPVFVPSEAGRRIGEQLIRKIRVRYQPDHFYYHLQKGGHVAAIHVHRQKKYFARIDLENFFYSIARNRLARTLQELGLARSEFYAKWSTVKNEFLPPPYAVPYGFVQSPLLASVVLSKSLLGQCLREIDGLVVVSVYVDDIAISGNNKQVLARTYNKLKRAVVASNFRINVEKSASPGLSMELFNCHLERMRCVVTEQRREQFYSIPRTPQSGIAFEEYCKAIENGNSI
jgi:Reverse transcriptase (RNA-dependent DNA polymerase)